MTVAKSVEDVFFKVHERDQETDFCLLVVRKMLRTNSRHVKVCNVTLYILG